MDDKISILDEKQRIIYLTYKAYQKSGKKLPRTVLANLRKRLGLRQTTVRVYKKAACEALNDLELLKALSTATALCRENNVDISDIINSKAG